MLGGNKIDSEEEQNREAFFACVNVFAYASVYV